MLCRIKSVLIRLLWLLPVITQAHGVSVNADDGFVGAAACKGCHEQAYKDWQGSDHDWAMQPATAATVLGDFNNVVFEHFGEKTVFSESAGQYFISTLNATGKMEKFPVAYTFGHYPLQQYLLAGPNGRYQAFTVAWDSRPEAQGGQQWFHLYPDEATPPGDLLHWTGTYFTWNNRCADCHSTNLKKNYDAVNDRYTTTFAEVNVACEACHGPGQAHLTWAQKANKTDNAAESSAAHFGLVTQLRPVVQWLANPNSPTLKSTVSAPHELTGQLAVCGGCHARRAPLGDAQPGVGFDHNYQLQLPQPPLYHADGQINDEVFVLGSFMQSKMFHNGVECSNCHNPHTLKLKLPGNQVCSQCHNPTVFDSPAHHHHVADSNGAMCVSCHMPEKTYMQVDPRRDHSLRIPRPDLTLNTGVPNACNQCHQDKSAVWAANSIQSWTTGSVTPEQTSSSKTRQHFSDLLAPALNGDHDSLNKLLVLATDTEIPAIVQATALTQLNGYPDRASIMAAQQQLRAPQPLVRAAAIGVFELLPLPDRQRFLLPLLNDSSPIVRQAVVRLLAGIDISRLSVEQRQQWQQAKTEYENTLAYNADSPRGQLNIGLYRLALGDMKEAEAAYERALAQDPFQLAAYLNLADLYRQQKLDEKGWAILQKGMQKLPDAGQLYYAGSLLKVRQKAYREAETLLNKALSISPNNPQYLYLEKLLQQQLSAKP